MGDSKVTKGEIFELAQAMGNNVNDLDRRIRALSFTLDCVLDVLDDKLPRMGDEPNLAEQVKAEIQRRIEAAKTKPPEPVGQTPLISVPR